MLSMVEIDFFWPQASAAVILLYQTKNRNFFPLCKIWFSRNIRYQWSSIYGTQYLFLSYTAYNLFMHIIFSSKLFSDFFSWGLGGTKALWYVTYSHLFWFFFLFFSLSLFTKIHKKQKILPRKNNSPIANIIFLERLSKK